MCSLRAIPTPNPDEGVGKGLLEDLAIAMTRAEGEHEAMVITFGFESCGGPLAGHDPVVVSVLGVIGAKVVLGDVCENAQRLFGTVLNKFHAGMVFPGARWIFGLLGSIVVLLSHEGARVGDDTPEPIGPEPTHRKRGRATGAATDHGLHPGIVSERQFGVSRFDIRVAQYGRQHLVLDETSEAVGNGVVF